MNGMAVITTPRRPSAVDEAEARREADRLRLPYVPRRSFSRERLARDWGASVVLFVAAEARSLWIAGASQPWRFHGGMAVLRIRRLVDGGEIDPFLLACDLRPGDRFLDCTGGACGDALVAAHAVGDGGRVEVIEASPLLCSVISHGVEKVRFGEPAIDRALDRMRVVEGDHLERLRALPSRSFDVVYFDPMFREATKSAPGFDVVRSLADPRPLSAEALAEAKRVARRRVVIQDRRNGGELERLGVPELPVMGRASAVRFGVATIDRPE